MRPQEDASPDMMAAVIGTLRMSNLAGGPKVLKFAPVSFGTIVVTHDQEHRKVALNAVVALLPRYYGRSTS